MKLYRRSGRRGCLSLREDSVVGYTIYFGREYQKVRTEGL